MIDELICRVSSRVAGGAPVSDRLVHYYSYRIYMCRDAWTHDSLMGGAFGAVLTRGVALNCSICCPVASGETWGKANVASGDYVNMFGWDQGESVSSMMQSDGMGFR